MVQRTAQTDDGHTVYPYHDRRLSCRLGAGCCGKGERKTTHATPTGLGSGLCVTMCVCFMHCAVGPRSRETGVVRGLHDDDMRLASLRLADLRAIRRGGLLLALVSCVSRLRALAFHASRMCNLDTL